MRGMNSALGRLVNSHTLFLNLQFRILPTQQTSGHKKKCFSIGMNWGLALRQATNSLAALHPDIKIEYSDWATLV